MDMDRVRRALKETARRQGITEEQAVLEIEETIESVISQARKEKNQKILAEWEKIPCEGEVPTAYELVAYIGEKVIASRAGGADIDAACCN